MSTDPPKKADPGGPAAQKPGGPQQPPPQDAQKVQTYPVHKVHFNDNMNLSLISLLFCCVLGIFAVLKSCQARDARKNGDYSRSRLSSQTARKISLIAVVFGSLFYIVMIIIGVVLFIMWYVRHTKELKKRMK